MVVTCEIDFDKNPTSTFYSGQVVSGTITLELDKPQEIKGLILKILGYEQTDWSEGSSDNRKSYFGHKDYIKSLTFLMGSEKYEKCIIYAGRHQFTFVCELPLNCPPSFKSFNGSICYSVNVEMVRSWKFNKNFNKELTVISQVDLNRENPILREPFKKTEVKTLWGSIIDKEPLKLEVTLLQRGFVVGQNIPVDILVANDSRVPVKKIRTSLVKIVTCYEDEIRFNSTTESSIIAKVKSEGLSSYCTKHLNFELLVPTTIPTFSNDTTLIDISYEVQVSVVFQGLHTDLVAHLPITIGTIPLTRSQKTSDDKTLEAQADFVTLSRIDEAASSSAAVPLPPPSYEEATQTNQNVLETCSSDETKTDAYGTGAIRKANK